MRRQHRLGPLGPAFLVLALLLLGAIAVAWRLAIPAAGPLRREVRLNEFTMSAQSRVAVARDETGDLLAVWDSRRQQGGRYGVYGRRLGAFGRRAGGEFAVNLHLESHQQRADAALAGGESWIVWESYGQDGSGLAVLGRRGGGDEILLNEAMAGDQEQPVAAILADGRALAAWSTPGALPGEKRVVARLVGAAGEPLGSELAVSGAAGGRHHLPCVAADADGGFAVAWMREGGDAPGILMRRFGAGGEPAGPERLVAPGGIEPSLAGDAAGTLVLAWIEFVSGEARAFARRFGPAGTALGGPFPAGGEPGWQSGIAAAASGDGDFALAWNRISGDGKESDVMARRFCADGAPRGDAFLVNAVEEGWQALAIASGSRRLALAPGGRLACAWEGDSGQGDASAANLTLVFPVPEGWAGRLALRSRLALAALGERLAR